MRYKIDIDEFIRRSNIVHNYKYDYSSVEYVNSNTPVKIIYEGIIYEQLPSNHLKGFKPENNKKMSQCEFISKARLVHNDKYDYSITKFINVRSKILFMKGDVIYEQVGYAHLAGEDPENKPIKISVDTFIERSRLVHEDKYDYSLVKNIKSNKDIVKIKYKNKIYKQCVSDHMRGHEPFGITKKMSRGVSKILNYLLKQEINFIREYRFNDCRNILPLPFDFYLPDHNILIEYDGLQHFESVSKFGGDEAFEKTKKRDNIKNEYAQKNNIPLYRICYSDDIIEKLNLILNI